MTRNTVRTTGSTTKPEPAIASCGNMTRKYAAALVAVIAPFVMAGQALAGCDQPSGVNNVTVNCTGTTNSGFELGTETGVTINVAPNAQVLFPGQTAISILDGTVNNGAGALISGDPFAISASGALLTVNNSGTIRTEGSVNSRGAILGDRVTVTNTSTGIIAGNGGLLVAGNGELPGAFGISGSTSATVDNSGVIFGTSVAIVGAAVDVTNRANGLIQSVGSPGSAAISAAIGGVTVTVRNAGVIKGTGSVGGDGIQIDGVGNITNTASGLITGTGTGIFNEDGIFADGFTTVDNAGTISDRWR
jgi:hypothetical protein